jgi:hypothetical protein
MELSWRRKYSGLWRLESVSEVFCCLSSLHSFSSLKYKDRFALELKIKGKMYLVYIVRRCWSGSWCITFLM